MKTLIWILFFTVPLVTAQERKLWYLSLAGLAAANALDIHSSLGKSEANPFLAAGHQTFGWQGGVIKIGIQTPLVAFQIWRHHRHPEAPYKSDSLMNFAVSGAFTGVAVHNYGIR